MNRVCTTLCAGLVFSLQLSLVLSARTFGAHTPGHTGRAHAQSSCSGKSNDCKLPTRYLGEKNGCACFTCEYGKKTQRLICTDNRQERLSLMSKVRLSTPKKSSPK